MIHNYWIFPKYRFDDALLLKTLEFYKNDGRGIRHPDNQGLAGSGKQYAHDIFIEQYPDLIEVKEQTLNKLAREFMEYYNIEADWQATFFNIDADCFFDWHKDVGGYRWPRPVCNFMYCLGDCTEDTRAKISFREDDGSIIEMPVYKAVAFNPQITHAVDNRGFSERVNFRFPIYAKSYEYVYEKIRTKDESYNT